jgi:hypothetical protein
MEVFQSEEIPSTCISINVEKRLLHERWIMYVEDAVATGLFFRVIQVPIDAVRIFHLCIFSTPERVLKLHNYRSFFR